MDMDFKRIRSLILNPYFRFFGLFLFLLIVYAVLYKIYIPKINAFGCFDDCFNYVGGYFIGKGKQLYSQIYFNHMPLMAYISSVIQHYGKPINIYALVLQHRQALLFFSFISNLFIVWRFGLVGIAFTFFYEFSKFYVFGDRFLAEAFIVYPLVYMTGLGLYTIAKKHIQNYDIIFASIMTWFVVFMREPYVPVIIFLYGIVIFPVLFKKIGIVSIGLFFILTAFLFSLFPVQDFLFNVISVNFQRGLTSELKSNNFFGTGIIKSFLYPTNIIFEGYWNVLRVQLLSLTFVMGFSFYLWLKGKKQLVTLLFLFILLGLANLRPTPPGQQYYEAFHMINWYGLYIFITFYLLSEVARTIHKSYIFYGIAGILTMFVLVNPKSFIYQHVDEHTEFITNYGTLLQIGEVIKAISGYKQTLFTDGADELLYVTTRMDSSYQYSFYYSASDKYILSRMNMFLHNPPDIYYDFCSPEAPTNPSIPSEFRPLYVQWYSEGKPTCLYMKKSLASLMTTSQRSKAREFLYYLPEK